MQLKHYSTHPIRELDLHKKPKSVELNPLWMKPRGLWVSIEDGYGWKDWCTSEEFNLFGLRFEHEVILKDKNNILYLNTPEEIINFSKLYKDTDEVSLRLRREGYIDWSKVKRDYQGLIISPYQWSCRLEIETFWYYGWDCASGCLWDLDCIESFKLLNEEPIYISRK